MLNMKIYKTYEKLLDIICPFPFSEGQDIISQTFKTYIINFIYVKYKKIVITI